MENSLKEVFFLNTNKAWGGGEKWHLNAAVYLKAIGYRPHLICFPNSELSLKAKELGIKVSEINIKKSSFLNPFKRRKLTKILKSSDCLLLNLPQDFKIGTIVASRLKFKTIIYRRGMPHPIKNTLINKILFPKLTHIIANSLEIKRSLSLKTQEWFPKEKVHVLYNGVNPRDFNKNSEKENKAPVRIGCIGRLVKQKAFDEAIEIAKTLKNSQFEFNMTIAGKGPEYDKLQNLIIENNLEDHVKLVGHIDNIPKHMQKLDYFLFPSHFEGSPNTLIEAMASKLVCFAFDTSSMPEVIDHGHNGYLAPLSDTKQLAKLIIQHDNPKIREHAFKTVEEKFNYNKNMSLLEKLIS